MMDKFAEVIKTLADKLGCSVEKIYSIMVKQAEVQIIKDYISIYTATFFLLIGCVGLFLSIMKAKSQYNETKSSDSVGIGTVMFIILFLFMVIASSITINYCIKEMITLQHNPEYWALQEIFKSLK